MKTSKLSMLFLAGGLFCLLVPANSHAQTGAPDAPPDAAGPPPEMGGPPPPPEAQIMGFEGEMHSKVVTGAPYSAQFQIQSSQTLSDGNQINRTVTGTMYRDAQGRTRRETTMPAIGPMATSGGTKQVIFINDPVAGFQYVLHPDRKTAEKFPIHRRDTAVAPTAAQTQLRQQFQSEVKEEPLGTQTIAEVQAQGNRSTRTVPAGQIGNTQPIQITNERWYSPDLHVDVMTKRSDPRIGNYVFQLSDISRSAPSESLFTVPSDYTVTPGRPGAWMRHFPGTGGPGMGAPGAGAPPPPSGAGAPGADAPPPQQ
jgi:hypothetical protein